ncbi:MAG: DHA2 family efflux MFS transporter permease subunit, partial [Pseudomonadota bacterium]|nr:DHA2 family efflux MFS transporter permease subunit [Pseudomonadota bacterium]
ASLVPLSPAILLDSYPKEKHGSAMARWGVGVMVGPILGPFLGGLLTEYYSWRWVFYINVPFGILAWLGITSFVKETDLNRQRKFDFYGFLLLALGIGALQMMLDRGETLDWFSSLEVIIEAGLAVLCLYMFVVHINTHSSPFIETALFRDRNFSVGLVFIFIVGIILLATMALLPPFMQNLMGYQVVDVGMILAPRGFGTMAMMILVGKLSGKVDPRLFIFVGLLLIISSMWEMTQFTLDTTAADIVRTGVVQGAGLGLFFVPLSTFAFSTLAPHLRTEASSLFSLLRNIGSSIGISIVATYLTQHTQINHAIFAESINPFNMGLQLAEQAGAYSTQSVAGLAALNQMVSAQAATMAYLQDFRLMMWVTVAALPLVFALGRPQPKTTSA